jgi:hypothetical protein
MPVTQAQDEMRLILARGACEASGLIRDERIS